MPKFTDDMPNKPLLNGLDKLMIWDKTDPLNPKSISIDDFKDNIQGSLKFSVTVLEAFDINIPLLTISTFEYRVDSDKFESVFIVGNYIHLRNQTTISNNGIYRIKYVGIDYYNIEKKINNESINEVIVQQGTLSGIWFSKYNGLSLDFDFVQYLDSNTQGLVIDENYTHTDNNFTDADVVNLGNQSGTNTGDQDLSGLQPKELGKGLSTNDYSNAEKSSVADSFHKSVPNEFNSLTEETTLTATHVIPVESPNTTPSIWGKLGLKVSTLLSWIQTNLIGGSGGYESNLYLTTIDSDVVGYKSLSYNVEANETLVSIVANNSTVQGSKYLYPDTVGVTTIPQGTWKINQYCKVSSIAGGVNTISVRVFRYLANGTEVDLFTISKVITNTNYDFINLEYSLPSGIVCNATDRIGRQTSFTTTIHNNTQLISVIGNGHASYMVTSFPLRHSLLRDLSWTKSGHTGTANKLAKWNSSNLASISAITEADNGNVTLPNKVLIGNKPTNADGYHNYDTAGNFAVSSIAYGANSSLWYGSTGNLEIINPENVGSAKYFRVGASYGLLGLSSGNSELNLTSDNGANSNILFLTKNTGDSNPVERLRILANGNFGIGIANPTAKIHIKPSDSTAGTAQLKLDTSRLLSTKEINTIENDGLRLCFTDLNLKRSALVREDDFVSYQPTAFYSTGTVSVSGTTVTIVGGTFSALMANNSKIRFSNGEERQITGYTDATHVTIDRTTGGTVSGATFAIYLKREFDSGTNKNYINNAGFISTTLNLETDGSAVDISNSNLNDYRSTGFFRGNNLTNAPLGDTGYFHIHNQTHFGGSWCYQEVVAYGTGAISKGEKYKRHSVDLNTTWTNWARVNDESIFPKDTFKTIVSAVNAGIATIITKGNGYKCISDIIVKCTAFSGGTSPGIINIKYYDVNNTQQTIICPVTTTVGLINRVTSIVGISPMPSADLSKGAITVEWTKTGGDVTVHNYEIICKID